MESNQFKGISDIIYFPESKEDLIFYYHSFTLLLYISLKNSVSIDDFNKLFTNYKATTITLFKDDLLSIIEHALFHYPSNFYFTPIQRKEVTKVEDPLHDRLRLPQLETIILGANLKYYEKHIEEIAHIIFTYVVCAKSGNKLPNQYVYEKIPKHTIELSPIIIKSASNFIDGSEKQISRKFSYNEFAKFFVHLMSPKLEFFKLRFRSLSEELHKKYDLELEIELQNNKFFNSEGGLKILTIYNTGSKFKKPAKFIKCCWDFTKLFLQENELDFELDFPATELEFEKILMEQLKVLHEKRIYLKENLELFNSVKALFLFFKICSYTPINIPNTVIPIFLDDSIIEQVSATIQDTLLIANAVYTIINNKLYTPIQKQLSIMNIADSILTKILGDKTKHVILQTGHPIERGKKYCNHAFYVLLKKELNKKLNIIIVNGGSNQETDDSYDPIENGFAQNSLCREITVSLDHNEKIFLKHFIFKVLFLRYEEDANSNDPSQFILDKTIYTCKLINNGNEDLKNYELGFYLNNEDNLYCKYRKKAVKLVLNDSPQKSLLEEIKKELKKENYNFLFCDKQMETILNSKIISGCIVWQNTLDNIYLVDDFKGYLEGANVYSINPANTHGVAIQNGPHSIASQTAETCTIHNLMQSLKVLLEWEDFIYECFINDLMCRYNDFLKTVNWNVVATLVTADEKNEESSGIMLFDESWEDQQGGLFLEMDNIYVKNDSSNNNPSPLMIEVEPHIKSQSSTQTSINFNDLLYKSTISFKSLDFIVDTFRFINEPNVENVQKSLRDIIHLQSIIGGTNMYSMALSFIDITNQFSKGEPQEAVIQAITTFGYMALPTMLSFTGIPYIGFAYGAMMAGYSGYNVFNNAYSLYLEYGTVEWKLKSAVAYKNLYEVFANSPLQYTYDFALGAKHYDIKANDIKLDIEKSQIKQQLELKGEFGKKLYEYIYAPTLEEKYSLFNKIIRGELTEEQAVAFKAKHISMTIGEQHYDHCISIISENLYDHYNCYNMEKEIIDYVVLGEGNIVHSIEEGINI